MDKKFFLENGIVYLEGTLSHELAINIVSILKVFDSNNHDVIRIYIALEDANFTEALMLADVIRNLKTKVKTYAISYLGGYSPFIFLAGDCRIALKHSVLNFPRFNFAILGSKNELINFNTYKDKIKENIIRTYTECTGQEPFTDFLAESKFMKSQEMLTRNIATEVIGG